jgi:RNA polymerase sigma-70 factor, ECF subfamily
VLGAPGGVVGQQLAVAQRLGVVVAVREAVVPCDFHVVEVAVLDRRRVLHQILRHREAHDALVVDRVCKRLRNRVPRLPQMAAFDDDQVVLDVDDLAELVPVASDDFVPLHRLVLPRGSQTPNGNGRPATVVPVLEKHDARVAAMGETTPEADPRRLAEEARDRVRFEEEALDLADQVYRVARRLVSTREEAEDLMQETYARAFRAWRSFQPGTNLRAWLLRILTNLNIDRGRRQQRSPDLQPLEDGDYYLYNRLEEAGREPNVEQERVDERLSQDDVVAALSAVPHDFRDVIVLVDIGDFSYADAAQILEIPIGTVMSRLHRGRRILKHELADQAVGNAG